MKYVRHAGHSVPVLDLPERIYRSLGREDYEVWVAQPYHVQQEVARAKTALMLRHGIVSGGDTITYQTCPRVEMANTTAVVGTTLAVVTAGPLFAGSGSGTIGAGGFWYPQRALRIILKGTLTTAASAPGTWTPDWKIATAQNVTTGNTLGAGAAQTLIAAQTNISWHFEGHVVCRSIGSAGTLFATGRLIIGVGPVSATLTTTILMPNAAATTAAIDTTTNSAINFLTTLGSATDSMLVNQGFWEVMT